MWHSDWGRDAELPEPEPLPTWDAATDDELAALDALGKAGEWELGGRTLKLTNLDKVLFPAGPDGEPVTKRDLVRHHAAMAPAMLPYLYDRPLNTHRSPDGVDKKGFWHKPAPYHAPAWPPDWPTAHSTPGEPAPSLVLTPPAAP